MWPGRAETVLAEVSAECFRSLRYFCYCDSLIFVSAKHEKNDDLSGSSLP